MDNQDFLPYAEAVKLFIEAGLSEGTFRRKVKEYPIASRLPEGKSRGALYSGSDVRAAIEQSRHKGTSKIQIPDGASYEGEIDWMSERDLPYILAYDYEMYGVEATIDIPKMHSWWQKNPRMARIIFDKSDRRNIWGSISILPMKEETILKVLKGEKSEHEISADDILTYEPGGKYFGYVSAASIKPEHRVRLRGLIKDLLNYWCSQYPDIQLVKLYATAWSDEGWYLIRHLFFSPRPDLAEDAFELDLRLKNPSQFVKLYQDCIQQKDKLIRSILPNKATTRTEKADGLEFREATIEDIDQEAELASLMFGNRAAALEQRKAFIRANPHSDYHLYDQGKLVAYIDLIPLKHHAIMDWVEGRVVVWDISPENIEPFEPGKPVECLIADMITSPTVPLIKRTYYGRRLLMGLLRKLTEMGKQGIQITKIYAGSSPKTPLGLRIINEAGFKEIYRRGEGRVLFELDVIHSSEKILRAYQEALEHHL